jgi:hypothetical protein
LGDFNIHVGDSKCNKARSFKQLVKELGWNQLFLGRTHSAAHTLDLILTRSGSKFVSDVQVAGLVSDHHLVICSVGLRRPVTEIKSFSFRTYNSIDLDSLRADLSQLPLITAPAFVHQDQVATLDSLVDLFQEIRGVVESHAPLKTSVVVLRDPAPWINFDILVFRHKLRRAERIWRIPSRPF